MKIVIIINKNRDYFDEIINYTKKFFKKIFVFNSGNKKLNLNKISKIKPDILISFISDKILPTYILNKTRVYNINFHPGPPEYPGFGCYNFAIYEQSKTYGCTAHIMEKKVDTGRIIHVRKFKLKKEISLIDLIKKTHNESIKQYKYIIKKFLHNKNLNFSNQYWLRKPFKKKNLENLCKLSLRMSSKEIQKRIKATHYPNKPSAYIIFKGLKFEYKQF
jgi:methionyl-tRNA formyltransferase